MTLISKSAVGHRLHRCRISQMTTVGERCAFQKSHEEVIRMAESFAAERDSRVANGICKQVNPLT